jgi:hypothetical protein
MSAESIFGYVYIVYRTAKARGLIYHTGREGTILAG